MMNSRRRAGQSQPGRGPGRSAAKEQLWRRHVARQVRSQRTVRDYCRQAGISEPSFYAWRRELAQRDSAPVGAARRAGQLADAEPATARTASPPAASFLPVTIGRPAVSPIELALRSGLVIRVPAHDAAALRMVLELLERPSC